MSTKRKIGQLEVKFSKYFFKLFKHFKHNFINIQKHKKFSRIHERYNIILVSFYEFYTPIITLSKQKNERDHICIATYYYILLVFQLPLKLTHQHTHWTYDSEIHRFLLLFVSFKLFDSHNVSMSRYKNTQSQINFVSFKKFSYW